MTPDLFDPIYVQFGTLKQKLHPYETLDDLSFLINGTICIDDCVQVVGLTLNKLKKALKFGIPRTATAIRNGVPLSDNDLVESGDDVEFVEMQPSETTSSPHQQKATGDAKVLLEDEDHDGSKLVLRNFSAEYKSKRCFLGNTKPFAILDQLNRKLGNYVSLQTLRQEIWGVIDLVDDETIQRHASDLRIRLGKAGMDRIEIDGKQKGYYKLVLT